MQKTTIWLTVMAATLLASPLQAAPKSLVDDGGPSTRDYLADRSRVGSLAGTVVGGALTAHPVGTVVGAVVGYWMGKESDFTPDDIDADANAIVDKGTPQSVNPLASCFGEHSPQLQADNHKSLKAEPQLSLVKLRPIDNVDVMRAASAASAPSGLSTRRNRLSPCFYYSSW